MDRRATPERLTHQDGTPVRVLVVDDEPMLGDLPALVPQRGGEQVAQHRLVVDHQDAYGSAVLVGKAFGRSTSIHPAIVVPSGHAFLGNPYFPSVGPSDPDGPTAVEEAGVLIAPGPQVPDDAAPPAQVAHDVDPVPLGVEGVRRDRLDLEERVQTVASAGEHRAVGGTVIGMAEGLGPTPTSPGSPGPGTRRFSVQSGRRLP